MKYLPMMTENEIRYVCAVIPTRDTIGYFQHNPKEFAKICPGFRASSVTKLDVGNLIFRNRSRGFVEVFIEDHISKWLIQIQKHIDECLNDGDSNIVALLKTLPHCFFVDNISLYFKITGEEYSEEALAILDDSIKVIKELDTECERLQATLNDKAVEINRSETEIKRIQKEQSKTSKKLDEHLDEIKLLKYANINLEKNAGTIIFLEQTIENLKQKEQEREDYIQQLRTDLSMAKIEWLQLERKIREELAKQQEIERYERDTDQTPKSPKDLDEFKDYLGYNFESIGVPTDTDYCALLKDHLSKILFQGKPIIISRSTGFSLMRCISNTLVKTPVVSTLTFSNRVTEKSIDSFLSQDKRILCLDNFIGNYNETMLITICEKHRDKIIVLTVTYDHTLAYVPDELFRYCHYLNLNRIEAFTEEKELTEDPSIVDEEDVTVSHVVPDVRWSITTKEILGELGVRGALPVYKSSLISDELCFCELLAFDILPYCTDVLKIAPFNTSERLLKYAGSSGRCQYKELYRRWFS